MNDPFEAVVGLLDEEIELHRRLLELARAEQRALVRGDAEAVGRLVAEQERLSAEIRSLERARMQLLELLAEWEGRSVNDLTLGDLARLSPPEVARRFEHQRAVLAQLLQELADVNRANALLISSHLQYVRTVVSLLTGAHDGPVSLRVDQVV